MRVERYKVGAKVEKTSRCLIINSLECCAKFDFFP